jgi:cystathionine gamma-synthase
MTARTGFATHAVRTGIATDAHHGAVIPPIHLSTTFAFDGLDGKRAYDYTRSGNPTRDLLGEAVASLEGGAGAIVTASGMAAITAVLQLLLPDDLLVAPHDCYGGTFRLMRALAARGCFRLELANLSDPAHLAAAGARRPRMLWIETPSNPLLRITDVRAAVARARGVGALVVADNTFLSPALQRPIALGADLVVHSTTKYLNGHSDVVGGAVVSADAALHEEIAWWANCLGLTGAPFDAYLTLRGVRTLHARMRLHLENTERVVETLCAHPAVAHVHYPGLRDHPGHATAARQQDGFGAMVSCELHGGTAAVAAAVDGLRCFTLAESLGGVESLIAHPATMTHASMTAEARREAGISASLLRISVGIEDPVDLCADLAAALDRAAAAAPATPVDPLVPSA